MVSCGMWNERTVSLLSEKTGHASDVLWSVIEAQYDMGQDEAAAAALSAKQDVKLDIFIEKQIQRNSENASHD